MTVSGFTGNNALLQYGHLYHFSTDLISDVELVIVIGFVSNKEY